MLPSIDEVLAFGEVLVIGNKSEEFRQLEHKTRPDQLTIDLVRMFDRRSDETYQGICW